MGWMFYVCLLSAAAGILVYWKNPLVPKSSPPIVPAAVSIIIPARNEEKNLPVLLASLQKQEEQLLKEVIVVDDGSNDQTALVAESYGAKVVPSSADKNGKGKTAACMEGAKAAESELVLFLDADTWFFRKDDLADILAAFSSQKNQGALAIQPYHDIKKGYENFSAVFNILTVAGMNVFSIFGKRLSPAGLFGPVLLCGKEDYLLAAKENQVQRALIEGFALGDYFQAKQLPIGLYTGRNTVHFRMYPHGIKDVIQGWSKHFASGAQNTSVLVGLLIGLWVAGAFLLPLGLLLAFQSSSFLEMGWPVLFYLLYGMVFFSRARKTGRFSFWLILLYPIFFLFFVFVFAYSWLRTYVFRTVTWKGRKIDL